MKPGHFERDYGLAWGLALATVVLAMALSGCARLATSKGILREAYARQLIRDSISSITTIKPGASSGTVLITAPPPPNPGDKVVTKTDTLWRDSIRIITRVTPGQPIEVEARCPDCISTTRTVTRTARHEVMPWWGWMALAALGALLVWAIVRR